MEWLIPAAIVVLWLAGWRWVWMHLRLEGDRNDG